MRPIVFGDILDRRIEYRPTRCGVFAVQTGKQATHRIVAARIEDDILRQKRAGDVVIAKLDTLFNAQIERDATRCRRSVWRKQPVSDRLGGLVRAVGSM